MITRKAEQFKVFHAHTEILKNSPIIYMHNQLNKEVERRKKKKKKSEIIDKSPVSSEF